jgi:ankyrin repeat protein
MKGLNLTACLTAAIIVVSTARAEPIHDAARNNDVAEVTRLLRQDPTLVRAVKEDFGENYTPLHEAAERGHKAVAELLIAHGADVQAKGECLNTPLDLAVWEGHKDIAELLLSRGAKLDIFTAAGLGRVDRVRQFLCVGERAVNAVGTDGNTPLHWAVATGRRDVAELLLDKKADVNAVGAGSRTPLHLAAKFGREEVAEVLLARKADVNAKGYGGVTPIFEAISNNHPGVVKLLLAHKADVRARQDGWLMANGSFDGPSMYTPLHQAAVHGRKEIAELLLAYGADAKATDSAGLTPMGVALEHKNQDVVEVLRRHEGSARTTKKDR